MTSKGKSFERAMMTSVSSKIRHSAETRCTGVHRAERDRGIYAWPSSEVRVGLKSCNERTEKNPATVCGTAKREQKHCQKSHRRTTP